MGVNYFANLKAECHFSKIGCSESNFSKRRGYQCNLPNIGVFADFFVVVFC